MATTDPEQANARESTENRSLKEYSVEINYQSQPSGRCTITSASVGKEGFKEGLGGLGEYASKEEAREDALKAARKRIEELNR
jgi:hypothetical protein